MTVSTNDIAVAVNRLTYKFIPLVALLVMFATNSTAQTLEVKKEIKMQNSLNDDTLDDRHEELLPRREVMDSTYREFTAAAAAIIPDSALLIKNTSQKSTKRIRLRKPDPETATWLALAIPGGGQIYNRKFWKLPIVYGGFVGCLYAYNWNGQMYKDYRQAYLDIMDSDPNTNSYKDFFRPGYDYEANKEYLKELFKKRKDRYRRWRDLSIFSFIGVYALSVVDAYVDAQLSNFDISEDIHLSIEPQIIDSRQMYGKDYYGFNCNISF